MWSQAPTLCPVATATLCLWNPRQDNIWHPSVIITNHLYLLSLLFPTQTLLLKLDHHLVPSIQPNFTSIQDHSSISLDLLPTTSQSAINHLLWTTGNTNLQIAHWVHHLPNGSELTKRTALWTLPQLQFQPQAQLCQVLALWADLLIVLMLSILHSIKQHMLNVRVELQLLQPTTKVPHLMFGGFFSHMTQSWTKNPLINHHLFQIVVEAKCKWYWLPSLSMVSTTL